MRSWLLRIDSLRNSLSFSSFFGLLRALKSHSWSTPWRSPPWASPQIHLEQQVSPPEAHGCNLVHCPAFSSSDTELYDLMVTTAKAAPDLPISRKASLVVSLREQYIIPYGIHCFLSITSIFSCVIKRLKCLKYNLLSSSFVAEELPIMINYAKMLMEYHFIKQRFRFASPTAKKCCWSCGTSQLKRRVQR